MSSKYFCSDFIIRLCHHHPPPLVVFKITCCHFNLWDFSKESPTNQKNKMAAVNVCSWGSITIFGQASKKPRIFLLYSCDVCSSLLRVFLVCFLFFFTRAPCVCSSGRDELSKPSCCRATRVSSWRWSASAWGSSGRSTSVWIGWTVACMP